MGLQAARGGSAQQQPQGGLARVRPNIKLQREIVQLEQDANVEQEGGVLERAGRAVLQNTVVQNVLDVVSRPNYAMAGVYEEISASRGFMSAAQRAGRELFSGAFGIQGEKQGFGAVHEDLGYGPGGSLSGALPFIYSETGEGLAFKRGGFFDWTARGSLGMAMDIVFDPTTYITLGTASVAKQGVKAGAHHLSKTGLKALRHEFDDALARGLTQAEADSAARLAVAQRIERGNVRLADQGGVKMFGVSIIPGEVINGPAKTVSDGVTKWLHKSSMGEGVISVGEGVARVFNRDFMVRDHPDYIARKQLYLTETQNAQRELREMIEDLFRGTSKEDRAAVTNFIDSGGKTPLDPKLAPLVKKATDVTTLWAKEEQDLGLLNTIRQDYTFHAYDAPPKKVKEVLSRFDPPSLRASLQGSQKARQFDTLEEARAVLKDSGINPIEDQAELLLRRGLRHIHGVQTHTFFDDVAKRFGTLPDAVEAGASQVASEMPTIARLSKDEIAAIEGASRPRVPIDEIRKLSDEGKREFLRRRFERVNSPLELENVIRKYDEFKDLFPETTNRATRALRSFNGEGMATLDLPEFKGVTMPTEIAQDIKSFNEHFINREDVSGLLWLYDKFMNSFKVGVTSIFPAFHFRNAYSNLVQQFTDFGLSALNPAMHTDAVRMLAGDVNGSFLAKHGRRWGYSEVVYEAKRRGVLADYRNVFETFGDKIPLRTGKSHALDLVRHPVDTWKRFGGIIENEARLTAFTNYLRRGLDPETAAQRVNKVLFDYKNISKVERDVLVRMFPFYRWTRKNLALQTERLIRNPGQAALQAKIGRDQRTPPELLPSYLRGEFVFTLEADKDGNLTYLRGVDLPITDLNILDDGLRRVVTDMAPMPKMLIELGSDQDWFRRKKISETSTPLLRSVGAALDMLPERAKRKIEFSKTTAKDGTTEYRVNPTLAYIVIKSWALSRAYGTAERLTRAKSMSTADRFLDVSTGLRLQDVDVDTAMQTLEFEYKAFLESKAVARGKRQRFGRTFRPKQRAARP